jgi:hypothetical protein
MSPNCEVRNVSTVAPQSLTMLNDTFVAEQARYFAQRLVSEQPGNARAQVTRAWRLVYGTTPVEKDIERSLVYLAEQAEEIRAHLASSPAAKNKKDKDSEAARDPQSLALASLCQALVSANAFLYVE